jgi:hypothetical protein
MINAGIGGHAHRGNQQGHRQRKDAQAGVDGREPRATDHSIEASSSWVTRRTSSS